MRFVRAFTAMPVSPHTTGSRGIVAITVGVGVGVGARAASRRVVGAPWGTATTLGTPTDRASSTSARRISEEQANGKRDTPHPLLVARLGTPLVAPFAELVKFAPPRDPEL